VLTHHWLSVFIPSCQAIVKLLPFHGEADVEHGLGWRAGLQLSFALFIVVRSRLKRPAACGTLLCRRRQWLVR